MTVPQLGHLISFISRSVFYSNNTPGGQEYYTPPVNIRLSDGNAKQFARPSNGPTRAGRVGIENDFTDDDNLAEISGLRCSEL